jgi:nucleoside triphosphate diphosphatase
MAEPPSPTPRDDPMAALRRIMARLRDPKSGCPWDVEQTFASIAPYTIEEAYEVADAIAQGDLPALKDELGDLLLQVVFHARMAEEAGAFDFDAVAAAISAKMVRRHPHVFGGGTVENATAQTRAWEDHKSEERNAKAASDGRTPSALDGVALGLPALTRALKLQRRAARVGFDWPEITQVLDKIEEEIGELRAEVDTGAGRERLADELGDILFAVANLARHFEIDPEAALRGTNDKFVRRFHAIEEHFAKNARDLTQGSLEEMESAWQAAKAGET